MGQDRRRGLSLQRTLEVAEQEQARMQAAE